ncbi:MAG: hypothetical protein ACRDJN_01735 [Chloroflexota bacterium]
MAERKGKPRIIVEVMPEDEAFVRQVRAAAVLRGATMREWVMEALREKWEREQGK